MAGDWIKMTHSLSTAPEVVRIASALSADRLWVVGALHTLWVIADNHATDDGKLHGYTAETIDEEVRCTGFTQAVLDVRWLVVRRNTLIFPNFERHNGQPAKRRARESERKRDERKSSASGADKSGTREEKRRREKKKEKIPPVVPPGGKPKRKTRMTADWTPSEENLRWAAENGFSDLEITEQAAQFRDHWIGKGETREDWGRTWYTWMRNSRTFARAATNGNGQKCLRGAGHPTICADDGCRFE